MFSNIGMHIFYPSSKNIWRQGFTCLTPVHESGCLKHKSLIESHPTFIPSAGPTDNAFWLALYSLYFSLSPQPSISSHNHLKLEWLQQPPYSSINSSCPSMWSSQCLPLKRFLKLQFWTCYLDTPLVTPLRIGKCHYNSKDIPLTKGSYWDFRSLSSLTP